METASPRPFRKIAIWGIGIWIVGSILLLMFAHLMFFALVGLSLTACAFAFAGKWVGRAVGVLFILCAVSAQLHWIGGPTICLESPEQPYLWEMDRTAETSSLSVEDDGDTVSISFSSKSEALIPGARFAELTALVGAKITPFRYSDRDTPAFEDTRIIADLVLPDPVAGTRLFAPRGAQFRADLPFGDAWGDRDINVRDLPVLVEIDTDLYAPLGILNGPVRLGETALLEPARFGGRNLLLLGRTTSEQSERARRIGRDLSAQPEAIVDQTLHDWALMHLASDIDLSRYGMVFDCRPQAYQALGIGWLFKPTGRWF
ncbi:MAG: hypothetical protein AAFV19_23725 [Pseudomonadota bacterium]